MKRFTFVRLLFFFLFQALFLSPAALLEAGELNFGGEATRVSTATNWDAYVFPFRAGHNLSLLTGIAESKWKIEGKEYPAKNFFFKFKYLFHIPAIKNLGYAVGSSVGYMNDRHFYKDGFSTSGSYHLPGLIVALVYNVSPRFRILGGGDIYLERMSNLRVGLKENIHHVDLTMFSLADFFASFDWFYSLSWSLHGEVHKRDAFLPSPFSSKGSVLGLKFEKQDYWVGLGITYHFL